MNTLSRATTALIFDGADGFAALRRRWSALVNSERKHELSAAHHTLYLALLGKDWRGGFTPVTNTRKLANGGFEGWGLFRALMRLHSPLHDEALLEPFEGAITPEMLRAIRRYVSLPSPYTWPANAFHSGSFPFDAYVTQEAPANV